MKRVVWTEAAVRDLEAIIDYVHERDGFEFAEQLYEKLHPAVGELHRTSALPGDPQLCAIGVFVYHELLVKPYRIPFRLRGDDVLVLAVLDGRRDLEETLLARLTHR